MPAGQSNLNFGEKEVQATLQIRLSGGNHGDAKRLSPTQLSGLSVY